MKTNVFPWRTGTVLVTGNSISGGLEEKRMGRNTKVRCFPGAGINDMYDYLRPFLPKKPSTVILHIGTNDTIENTSGEIVIAIDKLKRHIESEIEGVRVIISTQTVRHDHPKASLTIRHLITKVNAMATWETIKNTNIDDRHLGKRGLHLSPNGTSQLARNIIGHLKFTTKDSSIIKTYI